MAIRTVIQIKHSTAPHASEKAPLLFARQCSGALKHGDRFVEVQNANGKPVWVAIDTVIAFWEAPEEQVES